MEVKAHELNAKVESRAYVNSKRREFVVSSVPEGNVCVKTPIGRIEKPKKTRTGRKRLFTPTKMRNSINQYLSWCEANDRVPSIKGLMIHLKMHKSQYYTYCEYPEFTDIMEQARLVISEWCENDVYRTPGAASGKIAYMKNIHGWTEKVEQNNTTVNMSVDEAKAKLESLAPLLLEALQQKMVVDQLVITEKPQDIVAEVIDIKGKVEV